VPYTVINLSKNRFQEMYITVSFNMEFLLWLAIVITHPRHKKKCSHTVYEAYVCLRSALFQVIMQRVVLISYWQFGTTNSSHLQGSSIEKCCPKMSVRNYLYLLCNNYVCLFWGLPTAFFINWILCSTAVVN
jgi:hypothetical protein